MAARDPRELSKSRLPRLRRGLFLALLFGAFPFLAGWCPGFLNQHRLFILGSICCEVSTGAWLLVAFLFQTFADSQRAAYIDQFVSDPLTTVPPPVSDLETPPFWLRAWNWANVALFLLLVTMMVNVFATLPTS